MFCCRRSTLTFRTGWSSARSAPKPSIFPLSISARQRGMRSPSAGCGASAGDLASDGAGAVAAVAQTLSLPADAGCRR